MAYKIKVKPKSTAQSGSHHDDHNKDGSNKPHSPVHQTSPGCMLTFVRWYSAAKVVDGLSEDAFAIKEPLVVTEDILSVSVQQSKASVTPTVQITLKSNKVNYFAAVNLGDFVFVNMLDHDIHLDKLIKEAIQFNPINGFHSGFKGLFRVNAITKDLQISPHNGAKQVVYNITGHGFSEFNNKIYFNPNKFNTAAGSGDTTSLVAYKERMNIKLDQLTQGGDGVEAVVAAMIESIVGSGPQASADKLSPNRQFVVPSAVGTLMGINNAKEIQDIYTYVFGVQKYSTSSSAADPAIGLTPSNLQVKNNAQNSDRVFYTTNRCEGTALITPQYWNQTPGWSILQTYANLDINEIFVSYRTHVDGSILPTMVLRQIPFSTPAYNEFPYTQFYELPRWEISPALVMSYRIGKDDALRINFVQMYGFPPQGASNQRVNLGDQDRMGNSVEDIGDIQRFGLRPNIRNNSFDEPRFIGKELTPQPALAPKWARLLGDMQIGQHNRLGGSMTCAGIEEPIAVGDNLEFDGVVFHIETVAHIFQVNPQIGTRKFITQLALSNGLPAAEDNTIAEKRYESVQDDINEDFDNDALQPGINGTKNKKPKIDSPTNDRVREIEQRIGEIDQDIKKEFKKIGDFF